MAIGQSNAVITPEDLLGMPDNVRFELVEGRLVEKAMGWEACDIASECHRRLANHARDRGLGWAVMEASYQCFPDAPDKVRRPDVSFVKRGRLPQERRPKGHCPIAPDLAVEVVSPHDLFSDVESKVEEYFAAGVSLVWIIDPPTRKVHVYRPNESAAQRLGENDELTGEEVLPEFRCRVSDIFAPAIEAAENSGD